MVQGWRAVASVGGGGGGGRRCGGGSRRAIWFGEAQGWRPVACAKAGVGLFGVFLGGGGPGGAERRLKGVLHGEHVIKCGGTSRTYRRRSVYRVVVWLTTLMARYYSYVVVSGDFRSFACLTGLVAWRAVLVMKIVSWLLITRLNNISHPFETAGVRRCRGGEGGNTTEEFQ